MRVLAPVGGAGGTNGVVGSGARAAGCTGAEGAAVTATGAVWLVVNGAGAVVTRLATCVMKPSRSCLVMRLPAPVPFIFGKIDVVLAGHPAHQR